MQETNLIEQGQSADAIASEIAAAAPTMTLCSYGNKLTRENWPVAAHSGSDDPIKWSHGDSSFRRS